MYAKGFFDAYDIDRRVYVADSFRGLPNSNVKKDADWASNSIFGVSKSQVMDHFARYQLLDERVEFVEGWFNDSLPVLKKRLKALGLVRLDGDMFESTISILCNVYESIEIGGIWIVDDWGIKTARTAVNMFLAHHQAKNVGPIIIDRFAAYFQKTMHITVDDAWCSSTLKNSAALLVALQSGGGRKQKMRVRYR